jgi:hypothetical protein
MPKESGSDEDGRRVMYDPNQILLLTSEIVFQLILELPFGMVDEAFLRSSSRQANFALVRNVHAEERILYINIIQMHF